MNSGLQTEKISGACHFPKFVTICRLDWLDVVYSHKKGAVHLERILMSLFFTVLNSANFLITIYFWWLVILGLMVYLLS